MTTGATGQRTWQQYAAEVKADLDRAVARNTELANEHDAIRRERDELKVRVNGLDRGNRDTRTALASSQRMFDALKLAFEERRVNAQLERQLADTRAELERRDQEQARLAGGGATPAGDDQDQGDRGGNLPASIRKPKA